MFKGFEVEFESVNPTTRMARVCSAVGTFSARWMGNDVEAAELGKSQSVELTTQPTAVWGVDITQGSPDEPDAIVGDDQGCTFVGRVLGVEDGIAHYGDGGRFIPVHDLDDGIFYLRVGDFALMFDSEGLAADAAGRRVRVRVKQVELWPQ